MSNVKHCPRDAAGFCWIALWDQDDCGGLAGETKSKARCPTSPAEAERRKEAARLRVLREIGGKPGG